jgi:hypothetical protein
VIVGEIEPSGSEGGDHLLRCLIFFFL